jgi:hypothetical protein
VLERRAGAMPDRCPPNAHQLTFVNKGWLSLYGKGGVSLDELHCHHIACRKLDGSLPQTLRKMTMHPSPSIPIHPHTITSQPLCRVCSDCM